MASIKSARGHAEVRSYCKRLGQRHTDGRCKKSWLGTDPGMQNTVQHKQAEPGRARTQSGLV
jgi:hypothetical protein